MNFRHFIQCFEKWNCEEITNKTSHQLKLSHIFIIKKKVELGKGLGIQFVTFSIQWNLIYFIICNFFFLIIREILTTGATRADL